MKPQWILVANGSIARLFRRDASGDPLVPLGTIDFPEGRLKGGELERDRPGHERHDHRSAAARFEPRTDTRHKQLHRFAQELADYLQGELDQGAWGALWLIASAPLLGALKAALSPAVRAQVQLMHEADYTGLDTGALETRLHALHAHAL